MRHQMSHGCARLGAMICDHPEPRRDARGRCRECENERARARKRKRYKYVLTPAQQERTNAGARRRAAALRSAALAHYGTRCECCGTTHIQHLVIDHVDGGGNEHRRETGHGTSFYRWLRANDYPDGFQTLCHNCNFAKAAYGGCTCSNGNDRAEAA